MLQVIAMLFIRKEVVKNYTWCLESHKAKTITMCLIFLVNKVKHSIDIRVTIIVTTFHFKFNDILNSCIVYMS